MQEYVVVEVPGVVEHVQNKFQTVLKKVNYIIYFLLFKLKFFLKLKTSIVVNRVNNVKIQVKIANFLIKVFHEVINILGVCVSQPLLGGFLCSCRTGFCGNQCTNRQPNCMLFA